MVLYYFEKVAEKIINFNAKIIEILDVVNEILTKLLTFASGIAGILVTLYWLF